MRDPSTPFNAVEFIGFIVVLAAMVYLSFRQMIEKRRKEASNRPERKAQKKRLSTYEKPSPLPIKPSFKAPSPPAIRKAPSVSLLKDEKEASVGLFSVKNLSAKTLIIHKTIIDPPKAFDDTFKKHV